MNINVYITNHQPNTYNKLQIIIIQNKLEEKNNKLKANNKSLVSNMACINTKLCNSLSENNTLKRQLADQHESIKLMEAMKNKLQQKMENNKENEELSSKILMTDRKSVV